jgi:RNA polymerase sigma-70 factor (ECF subfamily)
MQISDSTLIEQLQSGDDPAFDELMCRYKRPVLNFCYRLLGNVCDAEDVAQEVFVCVYRHVRDFQPERKFSTWLFALARNACIDRLRYRARHPTEPLDAVAEPAVQPAEIDELSEAIAAAIAELPEEQRTAIILSEYHDASHAEIAQVMHCSEKSVEARLYRARKTLQHRLRPWRDVVLV